MASGSGVRGQYSRPTTLSTQHTTTGWHPEEVSFHLGCNGPGKLWFLGALVTMTSWALRALVAMTLCGAPGGFGLSDIVGSEGFGLNDLVGF
jgi:hypothetical protein